MHHLFKSNNQLLSLSDFQLFDCITAFLQKHASKEFFHGTNLFFYLGLPPTPLPQMIHVVVCTVCCKKKASSWLASALSVTNSLPKLPSNLLMNQFPAVPTFNLNCKSTNKYSEKFQFSWKKIIQPKIITATYR